LCNLGAGSAFFVDDAKSKSWRCSSYTNTFYAPSYNGTSKSGIFRKVSVPSATAMEAANQCTQMNMLRVLSQPSDSFIELWQTIGTIEFKVWAGITLNQIDNKYYHDNGKEFTGKFTNPNAFKPCVYITSSFLQVKFTQSACNNAFSTYCTFY